MIKQLGVAIKEARERRGISTTQMEKNGIHPRVPAAIEKGKGYTIKTLINYLEKIDAKNLKIVLIDQLKK